MNAFTCITCSVAFRDADLQRDHYKMDWHRYNLKRKVAELGPVTLEDFQSRMARHEKQMSMEDAKETAYCVTCGKSFATDKAYQNHIKSKKHLDMFFQRKENRVELAQNRIDRGGDGEKQDEEVEEVDSDQWELDEDDPIDVTTCLFCSCVSKTMESNAIHMTQAHSFFLPDPEYITDLEGLMQYLGAKVGQGHICLWCDHKSKIFRSLDAVRKHMVDKGHCKILHEGDSFAEFADFYDYSKSYPDEGENVEGSADEEVDLNRLDDSSYELTLPSGAKIGHRSLMRYYRQNLPPGRAVSTHKTMGKVLGHYRSLGWMGITGTEASKKERDLKFMRKVQQKSWVKLGTRANKLQKHWRDPTMLY